MEVTGTIVSLALNTQVAKKDGGSYPGAELIYKDGNGKVTTQAWHENSFKYDKTLKHSLEGLKSGDSFVMVKEKEGEYWKVRSIVKSTSTSVSQTTNKSSATPSASGSTYATKEERAQTQVYIVRQSSIANAVNLASTLKLKSVDEVLTVASQFEAFVMGVNVSHETESQDVDSFENMDDDIPF